MSNATRQTVWYVDHHTWTVTAHQLNIGGTVTRPEALTDLPHTLARVSATLARAGEKEGLVILGPAAARRLALDKPPVDGAQYALRHAASQGWKHTKWAPIVSFYRDGVPDVHVGVDQALMELGPRDWPWGHLYHEGLEAWGRRPIPDMVAGLQHWHRLTGMAWQAGPGVMGLKLMRQNMPQYQVKRAGRSQRVDVVLKDDGTPPGASEAVWSPGMWRNPQAFPWAHGYDRRRAGLTAAGSAKLAVDRLTRGWRKFDGTRAGWWLISVPPWSMTELPHPAGPLPVYERAWVTTATMDLLAEVAGRGDIVMPDVIDSMTAPARQALQTWKNVLESHYQAPPELGYDDDVDRPLMRDVVNQVAKAGVGMLAHATRDGKTGSIYRPDWAASVAATKRCNGWRKLYRVWVTEHRSPLWLDDDCAWYGSDSADRVASCPREIDIDNDKPGAYRAKYTRELTPA